MTKSSRIKKEDSKSQHRQSENIFAERKNQAKQRQDRLYQLQVEISECFIRIEAELQVIKDKLTSNMLSCQNPDGLLLQKEQDYLACFELAAINTLQADLL